LEGVVDFPTGPQLAPRLGQLKTLEGGFVGLKGSKTMASIWAEEERLTKEFNIPPDMSPKEYLLTRMRAADTDEHVRTKIAIALLPFTEPKLTATATIALGQDFASRLERALKRSDAVRFIEAKVIEQKVEKPDPEPPKRHLGPVPDRRFRRI